MLGKEERVSSNITFMDIEGHNAIQWLRFKSFDQQWTSIPLFCHSLEFTVMSGGHKLLRSAHLASTLRLKKKMKFFQWTNNMNFFSNN